ncbi:MAG: hypothetical protein WAN75_16595, partial [Xanthobacteraceae bacterium]
DQADPLHHDRQLLALGLHVGRRYRFDLGFVRHGVAGVGDVKVNIVWDPPWDPSRMSDEARAVLNMW